MTILLFQYKGFSINYFVFLQPAPYCQQCGFSGHKEEFELVHNANEPGSTWGHHDGTVGEAAPAGYKYEKFQISKVTFNCGLE